MKNIWQELCWRNPIIALWNEFQWKKKKKGVASALLHTEGLYSVILKQLTPQLVWEDWPKRELFSVHYPTCTARQTRRPNQPQWLTNQPRRHMTTGEPKSEGRRSTCSIWCPVQLKSKVSLIRCFGNKLLTCLICCLEPTASPYTVAFVRGLRGHSSCDFLMGLWACSAFV